MNLTIHRIAPVLLLLASLLHHNSSNAIVYKAVASGLYSNPATWENGIAPPTIISGARVEIPKGITVTSTSSIALNGTSYGELGVNGSLLMPTGTLSINNAGELWGKGTVQADSLYVYMVPNNFLRFSGHIIVNKFNAKQLILHSTYGTLVNLIIDVKNLLHAYDSLVIRCATLNIAKDCIIKLEGTQTQSKPVIKTTELTGKIVFLGSYDVIYNGGRMITGIELFDKSFRDVVVDMNATAANVFVSNKLNMIGKLTLQRGVLNMYGNDLDFGTMSNFEATSQGTLECDKSVIKITAANAFVSPMYFNGTTCNLSKLTLNSNNTVKISGVLEITHLLEMTSGKLEIVTGNLKIPFNQAVNNYDKDRYIITNGGAVSADVILNTTYIFPVGTTTQYMPISITTRKTAYPDLVAYVEQGVREWGSFGTDLAVSQPVVNATWFLSSSVATADADIRVYWPTSAQVNNFDRNNAHITLFNNNTWDSHAPTAAQFNMTDNNYFISRDKIPAFNTQLAVFDQNTNPVTGTNNLTAQQDITCYPNPTHNEANISINLTTATTLTTTITDIQGREVYATKPTLYSIGECNIKLPLQDTPPGNYFVILKDNNGIPLWSGKLQKQ